MHPLTAILLAFAGGLGTYGWVLYYEARERARVAEQTLRDIFTEPLQDRP